MHYKLIFLSVLFYNPTFSQSWQPLTSGVNSNTSGNASRVFALTVYKNKLIVGGWFEHAGGIPVNNIASWDGSNWSSLANGVSSTNFTGGIKYFECDPQSAARSAWIGSMLVYNNELYVGGFFKSASGIPVSSLAKWNGINWSDVGGGIRHTHINGSISGSVYAMTIYNNELYVSGMFDSVGTIPAKNIAKWNGTAWSAVGGGISATNNAMNHVEAITVMSNKLYVGGLFDRAGSTSVSNIAEWDGTNWRSMGAGIPDVPGSNQGVTSLLVLNNQLYAGNKSAGISFWNGSIWTSLGGGLSGGVANALCRYGSNSLIAAGRFYESGSTQNTLNISMFNGNYWNHVIQPGTTGTSGFDGCVNSLCIFNGVLYAGGVFNYEKNDTYPGIELSNIARLSSPAGIENNNILNNFHFYPNPVEDELLFDEEYFNSEVIITDMNGKVVIKALFDKQALDISQLDPGVYIVTLLKNDKVYRTKMVKS